MSSRTRRALLVFVGCFALVASACVAKPPASGGSDVNTCTTGQQDPSAPIARNIAYGPEPTHIADILPACTAAAVGTIMYMHGGSYTGGTKQEASNPNVRRLRDLGWVVVSIDYRLAPFAIWPSQPNDVQRAIDWWRDTGAAEFSAPTFPLVGMGWSAGGHLAEWNNVQPYTTGFDASVSVSGGTYWPDRIGDSTTNNLFGLNPFMATLEDASSTIHVDAADPPLLHIHGTDDFFVDVSQAQLLEQAITTSGDPLIHSVIYDATCGHSLDCMSPDKVDPFLTSLLAP